MAEEKSVQKKSANKEIYINSQENTKELVHPHQRCTEGFLKENPEVHIILYIFIIQT